MRPTLIIFARNPVVERVKTRLQPPLTANMARGLYVAFLRDIAGKAAACVNPVRWYISASLRDFPVEGPGSFHLQQGPDLGSRMRHAIQETVAAGAGGVVLIGTDSPNLPLEQITSALDEVTVPGASVIGPALDGGYYLIGMNGIPPEFLYGIQYSRADVCERTRSAIHAVTGKPPRLLSPWYDIDTEADLTRLAADLSRNPASAPATAALIRTPEFHWLPSAASSPLST